jgi:hypothetical protein
MLLSLAYLAFASGVAVLPELALPPPHHDVTVRPITDIRLFEPCTQLGSEAGKSPPSPTWFATSTRQRKPDSADPHDALRTCVRSRIGTHPTRVFASRQHQENRVAQLEERSSRAWLPQGRSNRARDRRASRLHIGVAAPGRTPGGSRWTMRARSRRSLSCSAGVPVRPVRRRRACRA